MDRIAIVDDEQIFLDLISEKVTEFYSDIISYPFEIFKYSSSADFVDKLQKDVHFDICFVDMEMPNFNGLQIAEQIRSLNRNRHTYIIFVTSHPDYAISGYQYKVYDYIMKPTLFLKLWPILRSIHDERMREIGRYFNIYTNNKMDIIDYEDIIYIYKDEKYSIFVLPDRKAPHKESLESIYKKLNSDEFVFISRSYILNIKYFRSLRSNKEITLKDGTILELSKNYIDQLRMAVHRYYHDRLH